MGKLTTSDAEDRIQQERERRLKLWRSDQRLKKIAKGIRDAKIIRVSMQGTSPSKISKMRFEDDKE